MRPIYACIALAILAVVGCGGKSQGRGDVSGIIFDETGNPVRNAHVYADIGSSNRESESTTSGTYILVDMPADPTIIRAEITKNGQRYYGQNVAQILPGETAKTINIVVYPDSTIGAIRGTVHDRSGFLIEGAKVFARQNDGGTFSSGYAITNSDGRYILSGLRDGQTYAVVANARGLGTDSDVIEVFADHQVPVDFTLSGAGDPTIAAPAGVVAQSFTAPFVQSRGTSYRGAVEAVKKIMRGNKPAPHVAQTHTRSTIDGNIVEVDLTWSRPPFDDLLGYGIYRGTTAGGLQSVDFLRDPLAEIFADTDPSLIENRTYYYAVTSLNTSFDQGHGESDLSNVSSAPTLGDMVDEGVSQGPLTFHWNAAIGATDYAVYIFDNYPSINETSRFNNFASPVQGTSFVYNGPALQSGHRYYYILQGMAGKVVNPNDSTDYYWAGNTLSAVGSFVAP